MSIGVQAARLMVLFCVPICTSLSGILGMVWGPGPVGYRGRSVSGLGGGGLPASASLCGEEVQGVSPISKQTVLP